MNNTKLADAIRLLREKQKELEAAESDRAATHGQIADWLEELRDLRALKTEELAKLMQPFTDELKKAFEATA